MTSILTLPTIGKTSQRSLPALPSMILTTFLTGWNRLILPLNELLLVIPGRRGVSLSLVVIVVEVIVVVAVVVVEVVPPLYLATLLAFVLIAEATVVSVVWSVALFPLFLSCFKHPGPHLLKLI